MKIAIMGIGGVGGYYGSLLAKHYAENRAVEVIFIARGRHLEAIRTKRPEGTEQGKRIHGTASAGNG